MITLKPTNKYISVKERKVHSKKLMKEDRVRRQKRSMDYYLYQDELDIIDYDEYEWFLKYFSPYPYLDYEMETYELPLNYVETFSNLFT